MSNQGSGKRPPQKLTLWVRGGGYAVSVDVEAVFPPDDTSEACLTPDTVHFLEDLAEKAYAGDVEALRRAGTVYSRV